MQSFQFSAFEIIFLLCYFASNPYHLFLFILLSYEMRWSISCPCVTFPNLIVGLFNCSIFYACLCVKVTGISTYHCEDAVWYPNS